MKKTIGCLLIQLSSLIAAAQNTDAEFNSVSLNTLHFKTSGKYLHYNTGNNYADFGTIPNALLNGNYILHLGNFNSYVPGLTGNGASGNWNINAASATSWGGTATYTNSGLTGIPAYLMAYDSENNTWKPADVLKTRSFLNIPANGETFASISDRGSTTSAGREIQFRSTSDIYTFAGGNTGYARIGAYGNSGWQNLIINDGGGNVGIGTTSPAYKLDVNGSANFRGTFRVQSPGASNPTIGARNPLYLDAANYNSNSSAIVFVKGNEQVAEIASDILANGGKDLYMMAGGNIVLDPWNGSGNIGIGTQSPQSKLAVNGIITSKKIKVTQEGWADYVFDSSYNLTPLHQVEQFIRKNKHLPEIPSATEVKKDGLDLGDNQTVLLKKIEELTLYIIEQNKEITELKKQMKDVQSKL